MNNQIRYYIADADDRYWSDEFGWDEYFQFAKLYSPGQRNNLPLPAGGHWEKLEREYVR